MTYRQNATEQMLAEVQYTENPAERKLLEQPIGRWGKMWQEWIRTEYPTEVQVLITEGIWQLIPREIDIEAENRFRKLDVQYRQQDLGGSFCPRTTSFEEILRWRNAAVERGTSGNGGCSVPNDITVESLIERYNNADINIRWDSFQFAG